MSVTLLVAGMATEVSRSSMHEVIRPTAILTWGLSDRYTWVPTYFKRRDGMPNRPTSARRRPQAQAVIRCHRRDPGCKSALIPRSFSHGTTRTWNEILACTRMKGDDAVSHPRKLVAASGVCSIRRFRSWSAFPAFAARSILR